MNGDLLGGAAHVIAKCPRCDATLMEPEHTFDEGGGMVYEGATNYWCPACGWEAPETTKDDDE